MVDLCHLLTAVLARQAASSRSARIVVERQLGGGARERHHHALNDESASVGCVRPTTEANQLVLSQALESLHDQIPADQEQLYEEYLAAETRLPLKNIERMSSPTVWWGLHLHIP